MENVATIPLQRVTPNENVVEKARPNNIEAEQALLGAILLNNDIYERVSNYIDARHFYDPLHGKLFKVMGQRIARQSIVNPVTLKSFVEDDTGLSELGGTDYLVRLVESAISVHASRSYAEQIFDLSLRRDLIDLGLDISDKAKVIHADTTARDLIEESERKLYNLSEHGQTDSGFNSFTKSATEAVKTALLALERQSGLSGVATGLLDLDEKLGGLQKSDLIIIAGRPSMGKTALATNIAFHVAKKYKSQNEADSLPPDGGVVGFFSLEMSSDQLAARILAEASGIPTWRIRKGELNKDDYKRYAEAAVRLEACPLFIDDTPALPISQLAIRARRLKRTTGLDLLVVDYLQLVRPSAARDSRVNEVSEITQGLKAIAKELNIPVIAVSQLSRQVEHRDNKRPQLSDLRESGSIEQDADVVMFVYRKEYYLERTKPAESDGEEMDKWKEEMDKVHGTAEVIIGKQRHGPIGTVGLSYTSNFTRFGNLADREQSDYSGNF